jgi:hypothetical protein
MGGNVKPIHSGIKMCAWNAVLIDIDRRIMMFI